MLLTHAPALPLINFECMKSPYEYGYSVRIELAKLISVGTRITYQATGDAGVHPHKSNRGVRSLKSVSYTHLTLPTKAKV